MMDENSDSENVAVAGGVEIAPPLSVGKTLRDARISQGLSVADVADSIKFAPRQVEALEADDFSQLPELAFVRGFVRSYARLLHIDEISLLDALPRAHQQLSFGQDDVAGVPFSTSQSTRRLNLTWLFAALAVAVLLGIGIWLSQDKPANKNAEVHPVAAVPAEPVLALVDAASAVAASPLAASAVAMAAVPPTAAVATKEAVAPKEVAVNKAAGQGPIRLVFSDESWVDIKDKSGKTVLKQVNPPNSEQWVNGRPPFSLVIGNASSVRLYYEGEEIDLDEFTEVEVARLILE